MSGRSPWKTDADWERRLTHDAERIRIAVPTELVEVHRRIVHRALPHANALLLTGSTARRRRTAISDLDYHLIGERIELDDLPDEVDMHVVSREQLQQRLADGDDFTQWSLRFGLVVFDDGTARGCIRQIAEGRLWPDVARKRQQARRSLQTAEAMVASQDHDAALEQVRTALTLVARWRLLAAGRFPLSRAEIPNQLVRLGDPTLAEGLATTIHGTPSLARLARVVANGFELLDASHELPMHAPSRAA